MLKNRTEQHCWTTLIKTKARFLILSFGMWLTEFSSSAWNKALNNSKQILLFFLSTVLNLQNLCCFRIQNIVILIRQQHTDMLWWNLVALVWNTHTDISPSEQCFTAKEYTWQTSANCRWLFQRTKHRSSLSNLPDLELRNLVLWQFR